jgi:cysteine desulfurase
VDKATCWNEALRTPTLLVSVMAANNETGLLQDIPALARLAHAHGARCSTPTLAQAAGKRAGGRDRLGRRSRLAQRPQAVRAEGHRRAVCAPPPADAAGAAVLRRRAGARPALRHRAAPLAVGFGEACRIALAALPTEPARLAALRDRMLAALRARIPGLPLNGALTNRICPATCRCASPARIALEIDRCVPPACALSTGSACTSADIASQPRADRPGSAPARGGGAPCVWGSDALPPPADIDNAATFWLAPTPARAPVASAAQPHAAEA